MTAASSASGRWDGARGQRLRVTISSWRVGLPRRFTRWGRARATCGHRWSLAIAPGAFALMP